MPLITRSQPRETVQVTFPDGRIYQGPIHTPLEAFVKQAEADAGMPHEFRTVAARVNNRLRELVWPVKTDVEIIPVTLGESDGVRIYRRSLSFLMVTAARLCFPDVKVVVDHALPYSALFCHTDEDSDLLTDEQLATLETRMREMVNADLPITRTYMSVEEAKKHFSERGDLYKVRLLDFRENGNLRIYTLDGYSDYFFGYMTPSTGYLNDFKLENIPGGFVLRYPDPRNPSAKAPFIKLGKLDGVLRETSALLKLLDLRDIGQLNEANQQGRLSEIILVSEALHERRIAEIGAEIAERHREQGTRVVFISGPSSSGKTTFSKRLAVQIMTHGLKPFTLELDNYFIDREKTPRDEKGDYDFEALEAINLELFNEHLPALIAGKEVTLPKFDFILGKSMPHRQVQLSPSHIIIVEGIHGLNPAVASSLSEKQRFKIYASAMTQLNIDPHNRISTTDVRLLRRIMRDAVHRGWTATDTLERWPSVRRGEQRGIFLYQEGADVMFNGSLAYELAVLRPLAEPHLLRVSRDHPQWIEANRLLGFLTWVRPASAESVPSNSILREFIGGSNLRDYHPGG
ncbi:MAG: nucleoside kinase [Anaerolineae bacterium]|nr:MAG: nucleoside kinase [Anaerolineae bacterium]MCL4877440.1 nucleoside kinase [Anaerolineae bacterium]